MNRTNVIKLIDYLIKNAHIEDSTISFSDESIKYALHELELQLSEYSFTNIIQILHSAKMQSNENMNYDFDEILKGIKKTGQTNNSRNELFTIYLPIGILINEKFVLKEFRKLITFIATDDLKKEIPATIFSVDALKKVLHQTNNIFITNTFAYINIYANNEDKALSAFWAYFQLIKALFELNASWGTQYIIHNTYFERGKVEIPDWIIIRHKKEYKIAKFKLSMPTNKSNQKIVQRNIDSLQNIANLIKNKDNDGSLDFLIYRALLFYNDALEQGDYSYCFLAFWQLLETISLAERNGGDTKVVVNRIEPLTENILGNKITLRATLESFAKMRNDLVHRGNGNIYNNDINMIKHICEIALSWIINNKSKYKNINTLEQYYLLRSSGNNKLSSISKAIRIIRKET